jgi:hypothetical protein
VVRWTLSVRKPVSLPESEELACHMQ